MILTYFVLRADPPLSKFVDGGAYLIVQIVGLIAFLFGAALALIGWIGFNNAAKVELDEPDSAVNVVSSESASTTNTPPSTQPSASPTNDLETELQKAKDMLDKGLIDEEEYKVLKAKIISGG